jgi:hypothetical protein
MFGVLSAAEDSVDCPLCCTELDVTDRAIQYCECGCEAGCCCARSFMLLHRLLLIS